MPHLYPNLRISQIFGGESSYGRVGSVSPYPKRLALMLSSQHGGRQDTTHDRVDQSHCVKVCKRSLNLEVERARE